MSDIGIPSIEGQLMGIHQHHAVGSRRKYRNYVERLVTIREKYEAGDYSLSELVKACSHRVSL